MLSRRNLLWAGVAAVSGSLAWSGQALAQAPELNSPEAKQIEALVDKAAQLVNSDARAAFMEFRKKDSEWFRGNTYIFVVDMKGTELFNAAFPQFEGKNLIDLKDKNGKAINRAFIELLEKQDAGWVDYIWPKPGADGVAKKWTYIRRVNVDGASAGVGAGIYLN
ncbi:MAG: cache domain-containing protein [Hyphomicrobiales bacterium]|nr:cache domain-containing protein [Hyphomicrobiales bacterium]